MYILYKDFIFIATGTRKTMVAAFDYKEQTKLSDKKLLFLAHRKEILFPNMPAGGHIKL